MKWLILFFALSASAQVSLLPLPIVSSKRPSVASGEDITSNLVLWWKFDESSGTSAADASGNGHTGTTFGSPVWEAGQVNNSLKFAEGSSQYVTTANLSEINSVGAFTIAAWVKKPVNTETVSAGQWAGGLIGFYAYENLVIYARANGTSYGSIAFGATAWTHISVVFDGSQSGNADRMKIYLDGVNQSLTFSGTIPATSDSTSGAFESGRIDGADYNTGSIDELRVYSRALTAAQVTELYNYP